ncbi:MAG: type II toxin-antitoxin system HicA family toxin [Candidatus Daviesbacteria bacterium]|nr:type II toxin-antitoxin system HicA family toxin [Candidatus Daviesbacteria bacterium]
MPKLPAIKSKELIKILLKLGFIESRQKGSHKFFKHLDGRTTVIPFYQSKDIGKGLARAILQDIKISPDEFLKLLKK